MLEWFGKMKTIGNVNVVALNSCLESLALERDWKNMISVYESVKSLCTPNLETFRILFSHVCHQGRTDELFSLLQDMKVLRFRPNLMVYDGVIRAYASQGLVDDVQALVKEMIMSNLPPTTRTYGAILVGYSKLRLIEEVWKTWKQLKERLIPNEFVTRVVIQAAVDCGQTSQLEKKLPIEEILEYPAMRNAGFYEMYIRAYLNNGELAKAIEIFNTLRKNEIPWPSSSCRIFIRILKNLTPQLQLSNCLELYVELQKRLLNDEPAQLLAALESPILSVEDELLFDIFLQKLSWELNEK
jgi:pentatricopeptide repeat protein